MEERLQKVLARAGFASRRGAELLMQEGRVTVNGEIVREPGTRADPATDDIRVDGVRVKAAATPVYLVLNKPRGVVTTRRDPGGRQTVMDLVPTVAGLFPVGRLDVTTEGLILLTNDGAFADRVAHPRYEVPRVYHAKVHGVPDARTLDRLQRGVTVEGERLAADRVRVLEGGNNAWLEVTLHEGKQHEVRRLLEAVGHPVSKLRRVAIGPVLARKLEVGQFRALEPEEIEGLLRGEGARAPKPPRVGRRPGPAPHGRSREARSSKGQGRGPGQEGRQGRETSQGQSRSQTRGQRQGPIWDQGRGHGTIRGRREGRGRRQSQSGGEGEGRGSSTRRARSSRDRKPMGRARGAARGRRR